MLSLTVCTGGDVRRRLPLETVSLAGTLGSLAQLLWDRGAESLLPSWNHQVWYRMSRFLYYIFQILNFKIQTFFQNVWVYKNVRVFCPIFDFFFTRLLFPPSYNKMWKGCNYKQASVNNKGSIRIYMYVLSMTVRSIDRAANTHRTIYLAIWPIKNVNNNTKSNRWFHFQILKMAWIEASFQVSTNRQTRNRD